MTNVRLPIAVCAAVADVLDGSHATLETLFQDAGVPGPPPDMAHHSKWKYWLQRAGKDPEVDSLEVLGNLLEEFMDLPPLSSSSSLVDPFGIEFDPVARYEEKRERVMTALENAGFRYYQGGRVLPLSGSTTAVPKSDDDPEGEALARKPDSVFELLALLVRGLPRAMHPLTHRRAGSIKLSFESEYDIQDLLHSQMRPWVADIRPEEFSPSYAGSNTRMDFLLPAYHLVIETKRIRDKSHGKKVGDELIIDIEHYRKHPECSILWCVIYDPENSIENPAGLISDLQGQRDIAGSKVDVKVFVFGAAT